MKQYLIAIAMVLALSSHTSVTAQKHRHTPRTEQVSDTLKHNQDAIEAFSDTTATNDANATDDDNNQQSTYRRHVVYEGDDAERVVRGFFSDMDGAAFMGLLVPILAIVCVGFLLPVIIVLLVFYFINRNRKEKYRLAQMAIQNGQPIPDQLLKDDVSKGAGKGMYNDGIRQMFTGVGLAIFLSIIMGDLGFGIGALVFFIGLGKFVIARQERKQTDELKNMNNDYNTNSKNEEL